MSIISRFPSIKNRLKLEYFLETSYIPLKKDFHRVVEGQGSPENDTLHYSFCLLFRHNAAILDC